VIHEVLTEQLGRQVELALVGKLLVDAPDNALVVVR
jgi:hypothetical protein